MSIVLMIFSKKRQKCKKSNGSFTTIRAPSAKTSEKSYWTNCFNNFDSV